MWLLHSFLPLTIAFRKVGCNDMEALASLSDSLKFSIYIKEEEMWCYCSRCKPRQEIYSERFGVPNINYSHLNLRHLCDSKRLIQKRFQDTPYFEITEIICQQTKSNNERNGHHFFKRSAVWLYQLHQFQSPDLHPCIPL